MAIALQDLKLHHEPIAAELEAAARRVIASGRYIMGPEVEAFEAEAAAALAAADIDTVAAAVRAFFG
jgi:dTDP-3-amino-3,4,6-trideoxy-alpha-D-glucose transaminase